MLYCTLDGEPPECNVANTSLTTNARGNRGWVAMRLWFKAARTSGPRNDCTLDVRHFPFDEQKCKLIFISWTFNGYKLNVTYNESEHQAIYYTPRVRNGFPTLVTPNEM